MGLTLTKVIVFALVMTAVQALSSLLVKKIIKRIEKRAGEKLYDFYINDIFIAEKALEECKKVYEKMDFNFSISASTDKKNREYRVYVD